MQRLKNKKTDDKDQKYAEFCKNDSDCQLLRKRFFQTFKKRNENEIMIWNEQYCRVYDLVYSITHRFDANIIYFIWVSCCQTIMAQWSSQLTNFHNSKLLKYVLACWKQYRDGINMMHSLTIYAQSKMSLSTKNQINETCYNIFVNNFIHAKDYKIHLFDSIVYEIKKIKSSQNTAESSSSDVNIVREILDLLHCVDSISQLVYYRVFAFPYLKMLQDVYSKQWSTLNTFNNNIIEYLRFVETTIDYEINLANQCSFTEPFIRMLAKLLYTELISQHQAMICNYDMFEQIVQSANWENINYLYNMILFDEDVLKQMGHNLESYLKNQLSKIMISDYKEQLYSQKQVYDFVQSCNQMMDHWTNITRVKFGNNPIIHQATTNSFNHYLNSDAVFACMISLFVHIVSMEQCCLIDKDGVTDLEKRRVELIQSAFKLLSFVKEKNILIEYNRHFLCQRVLYNLSYNTDKDINTIANILETMSVDNPFSVKLLKTDLQNSKRHLDSIKYKENNFELTILNYSLWNLDKSVSFFRLPRAFFRSYNMFRRHFSYAHPKKSIQLIRNYGHAIIIARFKEIDYEFLMSLKQASILLAFNTEKSLSYEKLITSTRLDSDSLVQILKLFCQFKLLMACVNENDTNEIEIDDIDWCSSTFTINEDYSISKYVNWVQLQHFNGEYNLEQIMQQSMMANTSQSDSEHLESNVKDIRVEAAIIRVLKKVKMVPDVKGLHRSAYELLDETGTSSPKSSKELSIGDFKKIVLSLEKRGYVRCLDNGQIIYEP